MQQVSPLLIDKMEIAKKLIKDSLMGAGRCGNIVQPAK
jgi:hypothetical protein